MASEPTRSEAADGPGEAPDRSAGEEAIRAAIAEHGEDVASAIEHTDEIGEVLDLAILTIASADDDEVDYVTDSIVNLVQAADGLSTEGSVALAEAVGESGEELTHALEMVVRLAGAVGAAEQDAEPVGVLGFVRGATSAEGRAGLGYLLEVLRALGRGGRGGR